MPRGGKKNKESKAVPFNPADIANMAKSNPYIQRLIEDDSLRDKVRQALDSSKNVYARVADSKTSAKQLLDDKRMQTDVRKAVEAVRDVTVALTEPPKAKVRKGRKLARAFMLAAVGGAAALIGSEKLRSKVLDVLFGSEEEFEYTPPTTEPAVETPPATNQTPAGETPAGETPAGESPAGETPAGESPAGETPAGQTPAGAA